MQQCVDPSGHDWEAVSFTSSAGSTPVACKREGCGEIGYRLDDRIIEQDAGSADEDGLF
jgi:hypothetical protein